MRARKRTEFLISTMQANSNAEDGRVRQKVLVAEDNEVTRELIVLLLSLRGHNVDLASDGEQALEALINNDYDVVLLDFHLPKMDGSEVAKEYNLRKKQQKHPCFVAITADMKGLLEEGNHSENFELFLPKPFNQDDICKVVEKQWVETVEAQFDAALLE